MPFLCPRIQNSCDRQTRRRALMKRFKGSQLLKGLLIFCDIYRNGRTGVELHRNERIGDPKWPGVGWQVRPTIRTQRTKLQSTLLAHVPQGVIQLSKKLERVIDLGAEGGVELKFADGTSETADLVVGADGIRSVCPPFPSLLPPFIVEGPVITHYTCCIFLSDNMGH